MYNVYTTGAALIHSQPLTSPPNGRAHAIYRLEWRVASVLSHVLADRITGSHTRARLHTGTFTQRHGESSVCPTSPWECHLIDLIYLIAIDTRWHQHSTATLHLVLRGYSTSLALLISVLGGYSIHQTVHTHCNVKCSVEEYFSGFYNKSFNISKPITWVFLLFFLLIMIIIFLYW